MFKKDRRNKKKKQKIERLRYCNRACNYHDIMEDGCALERSLCLSSSLISARVGELCLYQEHFKARDNRESLAVRAESEELFAGPGPSNKKPDKFSFILSLFWQKKYVRRVTYAVAASLLLTVGGFELSKLVKSHYPNMPNPYEFCSEFYQENISPYIFPPINLPDEPPIES